MVSHRHLVEWGMPVIIGWNETTDPALRTDRMGLLQCEQESCLRARAECAEGVLSESVLHTPVCLVSSECVKHTCSWLSCVWRGSKLLNIIFKILSPLKKQTNKKTIVYLCICAWCAQMKLVEVGDQYLEIISFLPLDGSVLWLKFWPSALLVGGFILAPLCWLPSLVMWPLLLYVVSSFFPQPNARPLWAPLHVSLGGNPVWKASSFCLWEVWGR